MYLVLLTYIWRSGRKKPFYKNTFHQLLLYRRFIDDLIIIWAGDRESLIDFGHMLNMNNKNIKLSWEMSNKELNFLDLEIRVERDKLITQTYFKAVEIAIYPWIAATMHPGVPTFRKANLFD